jgi:hypothetical protein
MDVQIHKKTVTGMEYQMMMSPGTISVDEDGCSSDDDVDNCNTIGRIGRYGWMFRFTKRQ